MWAGTTVPWFRPCSMFPLADRGWLLTAVPFIPYWIPNEKAQQLRYPDRRLTDGLVSRENTVTRPPSSVGRAHPW